MKAGLESKELVEKKRKSDTSDMMTGTMMNGIDTRKEKKQKKEKELKSYEGNSKILRALSEFKNIVLLGADMIVEGICDIIIEAIFNKDE